MTASAADTTPVTELPNLPGRLLRAPTSDAPDGFVMYRIVDVYEIDDLGRIAQVTTVAKKKDPNPILTHDGFMLAQAASDLVGWRPGKASPPTPPKSKQRPRRPITRERLKGERARVHHNTHASYLNGAIVTIIGWRRGRYDAMVPDAPSAYHRHAGKVVRFDEDELTNV